VPCSHSRESLVQALASGKSVILHGQHILDVKDLPSEAELAYGDLARLEAALQDAQAKKAAAEAELAEVKAKLAVAHKSANDAAESKPASDGRQDAPPFTVGKRKGGE
jgi:hypothetical protein